MRMEEFLWVEKYRPRNVPETILPSRFKVMFLEFVKQKNAPNLLLAGGPGCGKTTVARAFLDEIGASYILLNASSEGNIDTLRTTMTEFASTVAFNRRRKFIILDEADNMSASMQQGMRAFMDQFAKNCGFILTCNYPEKLIEPIRSRLTTIEFKFSVEDKKEIIVDFYKRIVSILNAEKIPFDKGAISETIKKFFPDMRKIINEFQTYSHTGKIDSGILSMFDDKTMKMVVDLMKEKNFTELRKWVANTDVSESDFYKRFYETAPKYLAPASVAHLVVILAKYSYQSPFCLNKDINFMACLTECMVDLEFL